MRKYGDKLKPIFLLFTMILTSLGIVFVVNQFKDTSKYVKPVGRAMEVKIVENSTALVNNSDTTIPQKVSEDNQGIVLSTEATNSCAQAIVKIQSYSVCSRSGTADQDYKTGNRSGNTVSKNSTVKLIEVTIPLELFSGSEVKDSNRKITSSTPVYKPAGEQIDEKVANVMLPPGSNINEYKSSVKDRPFSTPYSTAFEQKAETNSEEGEVIVDKKIINKCEHCRNKSNVNPDKSNKISEFMKDILYRPPAEKSQLKASDAVESCSAQDKFVEWTNTNRKACALSTVTVAIELVKSIPDSIWNECKGGVKYDQNGNPIPPSEDCIFPEDIIIKMTSAFGSDRECPDGVCTNAYMNTRNKVALAPVDSSGYSDKVYYTTACKVIIEGKVYTVKCAWDMSHLYKERKFSEYDDLPGVESTPSKDSYTIFLQDEGKRRSGEPEVKIF